MARKQTDRPSYRMTMAMTAVRLAVEHPEIHDEAKLREIMIEADYALRMLMDFRNIINGMVEFEDEPQEAARPYIDLPGDAS